MPEELTGGELPDSNDEVTEEDRGDFSEHTEEHPFGRPPKSWETPEETPESPFTKNQ